MLWIRQTPAFNTWIRMSWFASIFCVCLWLHFCCIYYGVICFFIKNCICICIVILFFLDGSTFFHYLRSGILRATGKVTGAIRLARRTLPLIPNSVACAAVKYSTLHPTFLSKLTALVKVKKICQSCERPYTPYHSQCMAFLAYSL